MGMLRILGQVLSPSTTLAYLEAVLTAPIPFWMVRCAWCWSELKALESSLELDRRDLPMVWSFRSGRVVSLRSPSVLYLQQA